MPYRAAPDVPPISAGSAELNEYEQRLLRSARRKKVVFVVMAVGMLVVGLGTCLGPIVGPLASDAWTGRKTKLTAAEAKKVSDLIAPMEVDAKKSQAAFEALWPKLRGGEIGARKDLGACRVSVPGPVLRGRDASTSLQESSQGVGWTFVDLTPASERSPIVGLKMPGGSIALNNTGTGERFVLPARALRTAPEDKAPTLDSTATGESAAKLRAEAAAPMRNDGHESFLGRVKSFADEGLGVDVVVFVDLWLNPKFSDAPPLTPSEQLTAAERGDHPTRFFEGGVAIARAFVWSASKQQLVCASQALAKNSSDITFRSNDLSPLQQDLVLQLEKSLQRSFVAVGDAPPTIERPLRR